MNVEHAIGYAIIPAIMLIALVAIYLRGDWRN